jgi:hypothetical protein
MSTIPVKSLAAVFDRLDEKVMRQEYLSLTEYETALAVAKAARNSITKNLIKYRSLAVSLDEAPALPGDVVEVVKHYVKNPQVFKIVRIGPGGGPYGLTLWGRRKNKSTGLFSKVVTRVPGNHIKDMKKL